MGNQTARIAQCEFQIPSNRDANPWRVYQADRVYFIKTTPFLTQPHRYTMKQFLMLAALGLVVMPFAACGPSPEEQAAQEMAEAAEEMGEAFENGGEDFADAMGAFGEALGNAMEGGDNNDYEPVERQALAGVIPESMNGMNRTNIESAREGAMGFTVTHAEADFDAGDGSFTLKVTDLAGVPMAGMLGAAWTMADIDRESDNEIERTFMHDGNRAYERYNNSSNSGEFSVIVEGFLVEGSGRNMSRDQIQDAMGDAPIGDLRGLR